MRCVLLDRAHDDVLNQAPEQLCQNNPLDASPSIEKELRHQKDEVLMDLVLLNELRCDCSGFETAPYARENFCQHIPQTAVRALWQNHCNTHHIGFEVLCTMVSQPDLQQDFRFALEEVLG